MRDLIKYLGDYSDARFDTSATMESMYTDIYMYDWLCMFNVEPPLFVAGSCACLASCVNISTHANNKSRVAS